MRTLMTVRIPVAQGNAAIKNGTLPKVMEATLARLQPEAAYFTTRDGERTALFVFDLKGVEQIPVIAEPFFMAFDARVDFTPVMNGEDLRQGLSSIG